MVRAEAEVEAHVRHGPCVALRRWVLVVEVPWLKREQRLLSRLAEAASQAGLAEVALAARKIELVPVALPVQVRVVVVVVAADEYVQIFAEERGAVDAGRPPLEKGAAVIGVAEPADTRNRIRIDAPVVVKRSRKRRR